jgi:hypothetical protein
MLLVCEPRESLRMLFMIPPGRHLRRLDPSEQCFGSTRCRLVILYRSVAYVVVKIAPSTSKERTREFRRVNCGEHNSSFVRTQRVWVGMRLPHILRPDFHSV